MPRKTIPVARVREIANNILANSTKDYPPESRLAIAGMLEIVLMETGNYHGFNHAPGVYDFSKNPPELIGDESRRVYH